MSNSLYLERTLGWSGILAEPSPPFYQQLESRHRKAWTMPVCLSIEPYPMKVIHNANNINQPDISVIRLVFTSQVNFQVVRGFNSLAAHIVHGNSSNKLWSQPDVKLVPVQCFPLYSILLAFNRTRVDYFSLDIEGHEMEALKTIPWHKVDIKVQRTTQKFRFFLILIGNYCEDCFGGVGQDTRTRRKDHPDSLHGRQRFPVVRRGVYRCHFLQRHPQ